jgi:hypothetical protein
MKAAVLCNGPSRVAFDSTLEYNYIIGCNIPWTKVNATVIFDKDVLEKWETPSAFYASVEAWRECKKRDKFKDHLIEIFEAPNDIPTSGHEAARRVISMGAKEIDIYGCDSWFTNNTESYTHQFVDSRAIDMNKQISAWRARWYQLMARHPDIKINFIGDSK